jgi:hypothetical protein
MTANKWLNNHFAVQPFLELYNDYRQFTGKYSEKAEHLKRSTLKDEQFV